MDGRGHDSDRFPQFDAGYSAALGGANDGPAGTPDIVSPYDTSPSFDHGGTGAGEPLMGDGDIVVTGPEILPDDADNAGQADRHKSTETGEHDPTSAAFARLDDAIRTAVATSHDTTLPEGEGETFTYNRPLAETDLPPHVQRLFGKVPVAPDAEAVTYEEWREAGDEQYEPPEEPGSGPGTSRLTTLHFIRQEVRPASTTNVGVSYATQRRRQTDNTGTPADTHRGVRFMMAGTRDVQGRIVYEGAPEQNAVIDGDPELTPQDKLPSGELDALITHLQDAPRPEINHTTPAILPDLVDFHSAVLTATDTPDVALAGRLIPHTVDRAVPPGTDLPRPIQDVFDSVPPLRDATSVSYLQQLSTAQGPGISEVSNLVLSRREVAPDGAIREVQVRYKLDHGPGAPHKGMAPRYTLVRTTHVVTEPFDPGRYTTAPLTPPSERSYTDIAHGTVNRRPWMRFVSRAELREVNQHILDQLRS